MDRRQRGSRPGRFLQHDHPLHPRRRRIGQRTDRRPGQAHGPDRRPRRRHRPRTARRHRGRPRRRQCPGHGRLCPDAGTLAGASAWRMPRRRPCSVEWTEPGRQSQPSTAANSPAHSPCWRPPPAASGGAIAEAAESYNRFAGSLRDSGQRRPPRRAVTGSRRTRASDFFTITGTGPAALSIKGPANITGIALKSSTGGALDTSIADKISQLGTGADSPDKIWSGIVTGHRRAVPRRPAARVAHRTRPRPPP